MKIAVFIDFSEGAKQTLFQAMAFANKHNGNILALNIVDQASKKDEHKQKLAEFVGTSSPNIEIVVGVGELFQESKRILIQHNPDYVFVCTHGLKGILQNLWGDFIVKLVQVIPFPTIVFQEHNKVDITLVKNMLFPIGGHENFGIKTRQVAAMAKLINGKVITYYCDKPSIDDDSVKMANFKSAIHHFTTERIPFEVVEEEVEVFSAGYAKQTLKYCAEHPVQLISLMANSSQKGDFIDEVDRENILVNGLGIPVLCCNA